MANMKDPAPLAAGRASELFCVTAQRSEDNQASSRLQAARLQRRFGLTPATAQLVASLAFGGGRK